MHALRARARRWRSGSTSRCGADLPAADLVIAADSGLHLAAALGLHVDRIVGDLDSADPDRGRRRDRGGRGGRTAPGRQGRDRSRARARRRGARRRAPHRRRRWRRRPPRPPARQPAAARVARRGPTSRSRPGSARACHVVHGGRRPRAVDGRAGQPRHAAAGRRRRARRSSPTASVPARARGPGTRARRAASATSCRRRARASRSTPARCSSSNPTRKRRPSVIVDIEVVPQPLGTEREPVRARRGRDRARAERRGCTTRSNALGTTIEGAPDDVWPLTRRMHESCLAVGRGARHHGAARSHEHADDGAGTDDGRPHREVPHVNTVGPPGSERRAAGRVLRARARRLGGVRPRAWCRRLRAAAAERDLDARSSTWRPTSAPTCGPRSSRRPSASSWPRSPAPRSRC